MILVSMVVASLSVPLAARSGEDLRETTTCRQPVAMAFVAERLFIANRRSGTVSIVDPVKNAVAGEFAVGQRLSDVAAAADGRHVFVTDEGSNHLVCLRHRGAQYDVIQRLEIGRTPVTICLAHRRPFCSVASLWARRVTLVAVPATAIAVRFERNPETPSLRTICQIDLPFAPRAQCLSADDAWLFVADSFGGNLAVIDTVAGKLLSVSRFDGHNIRGLVLDESKGQLFVSHQLLDEQLAATESHISWGGVISNVLRSIALEDMLIERPRADRALHPLQKGTGTEQREEANEIGGRLLGASPLFQPGPIERQLAHWSLDPLGRNGDGMGDPGPILLTPGGQLVVAVSGFGKIAVRARRSQTFHSLPVGARPVALAADSENGQLFVANAFDDSISIVDLQHESVQDAIALGPRRKLTAAERGERLFYDARLSLHGWFSCQSCHTDGHANGLRNDNLGDGSYGYPKRIPSLLGTGRTAPWTWNGTQWDLPGQVRSSLQNTMHGPPWAAADQNVADLVAYLETLAPPPGLARARGLADDKTTARGGRLFHETGCATCHAPPQFTAPETYDVGIHDYAAATEFNPPSLLGVSQRGPYFHDSRAATLREVFERFHHGETKDLPANDLNALLVYLDTL